MGLFCYYWKCFVYFLQPDFTSTKNEKRSNDKSKRGHHNTIFVERPQSFNAQNDPIQINQPSFYGTQLDSEEDQNNNDVGGIDIENPPPLSYPSMYFDVRQEEDGGILIEPDHIPSMASGEENLLFILIKFQATW